MADRGNGEIPSNEDQILMRGYFSEKFTSKLDNTVFDITDRDIMDLIDENMREAKECEEITKNSRGGKDPSSNPYPNSMLEFVYDVVNRDPKISGFVVDYPHGRIIRQAERNHYYRGENQIYSSSIPTLLRTLNMFHSVEEKELYKFVAGMRIAEFKMLLENFDHVQDWTSNYGTVLYEALAQHYGLETSWLDVTNDFNVALFFATCYHDGSKWKPLTKERIEASEHTRHGMIFHIPHWQVRAASSFCDIPVMNGDERFPRNNIWPIGFQPFMRCNLQYGYGINMMDEYPLQKDITFEKLRFRQSEKLSKMIFDKMQQGRLIYPHEGLSEVSDVIERIKHATVFSEESFHYAFDHSDGFFADRDECRRLLTESNILAPEKIIIQTENPYQINRQRRRMVNRMYSDFSIEKEYGIELTTRLVAFGQ